MGDKFASKAQTQEQFFKLKSQMKSMFELLLSSGIVRLDEEDDGEEDANFTKKPLGGFSCASCDKKLNQISLKASAIHSNWRKMPFRGPTDRLPKAG